MGAEKVLLGGQWAESSSAAIDDCIDKNEMKQKMRRLRESSSVEADSAAFEVKDRNDQSAGSSPLCIEKQDGQRQNPQKERFSASNNDEEIRQVETKTSDAVEEKPFNGGLALYNDYDVLSGRGGRANVSIK